MLNTQNFGLSLRILITVILSCPVSHEDLVGIPAKFRLFKPEPSRGRHNEDLKKEMKDRVIKVIKQINDLHSGYTNLVNINEPKKGDPFKTGFNYAMLSRANKLFDEIKNVTVPSNLNSHRQSLWKLEQFYLLRRIFEEIKNLTRHHYIYYTKVDWTKEPTIKPTTTVST